MDEERINRLELDLIGRHLEENEPDRITIERATAAVHEGQSEPIVTPGDDGPPRGRRGVVETTILYRLGGNDYELTSDRDKTHIHQEYRKNRRAGENLEQADGIWVQATVTGKDGGSERIVMESDIAFIDPDEHWPTDYDVLVSKKNSRLTVKKLIELITRACFEPGNDADDDSIETQHDMFDGVAHQIATNLLLDTTAARTSQMAYAVDKYVSGALGVGETVTMTMERHKAEQEPIISVTIEKHPAADA